MKKLLQILVIGAVLLLPFGLSSTASAVGTCEIGFTGPDSNNQCVSTTQYECTIENNTTVNVTNQNVQIAVTGNAGGTGNTAFGSVSSGSATNSNGTVFNATVTNNDGMQTCAVVATVPATVTPTAVTPTPQKEVVPAPAGKGAVAVLPNTSGDEVMGYVIAFVGALGATALVSRLVVMAYGRFNS